MLLDLIYRTKEAVKELNNLQYSRLKKILMVDSEQEHSSNGAAHRDHLSSVRESRCSMLASLKHNVAV